MEKEYFKYWDMYYDEPEDLLSMEEAEKWHKGKKQYVVALLQDNSIKYVIRFFFDDAYCTVIHLPSLQKRFLCEYYTKHIDSLFLREKRFLHDNGVAKLGYLYETDGRYRKTLFERKRGKIIEQTFGTTDVSNHVREMMEFGKYDSILPPLPVNRVCLFPPI
ncbi:hypothetical protein GXN76_00835 [Kroppenstedtia pulmonis]|uniref:Uncharacterized protein n=1 Tax=Kroppenstedtia pulmonis TaxID=1380685 RepID=A0A7D3XNN5_9BACL|nr:hypothetical protein [Kroppenstedtia pulmonis]QKG83147.1 hypothetical protein GXN76_00835 [Kroppenstedtia pulmonis]